MREDIKIKRFGGVLSSIVKDCVLETTHSIRYRVTTKYFLNEKINLSVYVLFTGDIEDTEIGF